MWLKTAGSAWHKLFPNGREEWGYSTFILVWVWAQRGEKRGLENGLSPNLESKELLFLFNLRLLKLKFDKTLGLKSELFPDFETLKFKFSTVLRNWKILKKGMKTGSKGQHLPVTHFKMSTELFLNHMDVYPNVRLQNPSFYVIDHVYL